MQNRPSIRHSTQPTKEEEQLAVDAIEQQTVELMRRRRLAWLPVYVEIIAIADAAKARDLLTTCRHTGRLVGYLLLLAKDSPR
jgi:hypothetical protein